MSESPGDRIKKAVDNAIKNYIDAHGKNPKTIVLSVEDFPVLWHRVFPFSYVTPSQCPYCKRPFFSYGMCEIVVDLTVQKGKGKVDDEHWTFYAYESE